MGDFDGEKKELIKKLVNFRKPICEVVKVGVVGTIYDVSGIVARDRQHITAQDIILPPSIEIVDMTQPIANLT
jgi:hypothetical protein